MKKFRPPGQLGLTVNVVTLSIVKTFVGAVYDRDARKAGAAKYSHGQERGKNSRYVKEACRQDKKTLHFPPKARLRETQRALLAFQNACSDRQMLSIISEGYSR